MMSEQSVVRREKLRVMAEAPMQLITDPRVKRSSRPKEARREERQAQWAFQELKAEAKKKEGSDD